MKSNSLKQLYHYTHTTALDSIMADGLIMPSHSSVAQIRPDVVWLSSNRHWEAVSRASYLLGLDDYVVRPDLGPDEAGRAVRLAVDPVGSCEWSSFLMNQGVSQRDVLMLGFTGAEYGSDPDDWFVMPGGVHSSQWLAVHRWDGREWR